MNAIVPEVQPVREQLPDNLILIQALPALLNPRAKTAKMIPFIAGNALLLLAHLTISQEDVLLMAVVLAVATAIINSIRAIVAMKKSAPETRSVACFLKPVLAKPLPIMLWAILALAVPPSPRKHFIPALALDLVHCLLAPIKDLAPKIAEANTASTLAKTDILLMGGLAPKIASQTTVHLTLSIPYQQMRTMILVPWVVEVR